MREISQEGIVKDLYDLGLKSGDILILHSSLASIGKVAEGAETVIKAFLEVLGPTGTLVVPTFGSLGILTDTLQKWPGAIASIHPLASVAAVGAHAVEICRDHWKADLAHTENTPYMRLADLGGYVCLMGVDQDRNTTLHTVEELLRLPYLKTSSKKSFPTPEGEMSKSWPFFPGPHRDFIGLDAALRQSGKMRVGLVGKAVTRLIKSADLIDICRKLGATNPAFVLCDNPHCAACVEQRADLRRARLKQESFRLAASAMLAGKYAPEIVDNCRQAGIDMIELDGVFGKPAAMIASDKLSKAVAEIRAGHIAVSALRFQSILPAADIIEKAKACGVNRIVLPLGREAADYVETASRHGLQLSFYNTIYGSALCSEILMKIKGNNPSAAFTFGAAGFARGGENPFLKSYKQKLRRFVDQLDVEDCLFDGTPQILARGNGEIKEMISILRCASFDGYMVLSAGNRAVSSLGDTVKRFMELLEAM